jgi:D-glycero-alpha-D-manno-heptose-7-phosphate kinase
MQTSKIYTRTPLRISFFGGGTDYPNWYHAHSGQVLSTTIDKYTHITCRYLPPFFDHKHRITYSKIEHALTTEHIIHPSVRETIAYLGITDGLEIHYDGDLPARTGLGSSSSFTVGLLNALHALQDHHPSKEDLASQAIEIEQDKIKEAVGSQDQVIAAHGGFNHIHFSTTGQISVTPIQLPSHRLTELHSHLLLFYSGISRTASEIAQDQIKNTSHNHDQLTQMHHMVDTAIDILHSSKPITQFGELLHHTWQLKQSLSTKITNPTITHMVETARQAGAIGEKLLGAGGGGFVLVFASPDTHTAIKTALKDYLHIDFQFESEGTQKMKIVPQ